MRESEASTKLRSCEAARSLAKLSEVTKDLKKWGLTL